MIPYFILQGFPSLAALAGTRHSRAWLLLAFALFVGVIGWRFQVGSDWNSYVKIYNRDRHQELLSIFTEQEPAFYLIVWVIGRLGGSVVDLNFVSSLIFCFGFFAVARRCPEPFLAIVYATPIVAVVFGMSATRQAMALGVIYYLLATWGRRSSLGRLGYVALAGLLHFSAIFNAIFVALGSKLSPLGRVAAVFFISAGMIATIYLFPTRFDFYSETYVAGTEAVTAPGALAHIAILAIPAIFYLGFRRKWNAEIGASKLINNLALASVAMLPAALVSSVSADRFSLYFWPASMFIVSSIPRLLPSLAIAFLYRAGVVLASMAVLLGWLYFSNHGAHYIPYQNWIWVSDSARLLK